MANMTIGNWIRKALGGRTGKGTNSGGSRVGKQVVANDGAVIGTITAIWQGADANDRASHEDTLGVQPPDQGDGGLLYIPSSAIASETAQQVALTVDRTQVANRGWRFRPTWLSETGSM